LDRTARAQQFGSPPSLLERLSPPLYQERQRPALRISPTACPWNPSWIVARQPWPARRPAGGRGLAKAGAVGSLQERALKVELIIGAGTIALGKEAAQMFDRLEERIGL
jgi:hypothetical protein